ncbi:fungal-specific transcription factor domain-containing protein [Hyaloscypha sp. PMI_1271]|nr:fungal-specific transcription factor domain-containing protein [Hyaloscypha sp. PMI_1271]
MRTASLPKQINDESSNLIHHYFTRVCKIAGCFDSSISPFRTIPAAMMAYSRPVFLLLQASSAAQLSRQHPAMRFKALSLQSEAFSAVRTEISKLWDSMIVSDELMLSCIIAGLTSSWYDVNDIGVSHVLGSQVLLSLWLASKKTRLKYQEMFILGAYVYWLAISSFVTGDPGSAFHFQEALQQTVDKLDISFDILNDGDVPAPSWRVFPHPLTGFSMKTFICVGKVGSLCRVAHIEAVENFPGRADPQNRLEEKAERLEAELLHLYQPRLDNFQDPQDSQTTINEILAVGEAYRCAGLLQLYMKFPKLLQPHTKRYFNIDKTSWEQDFLHELNSQEIPSGTGFTPIQHNWLRKLAFHILSILERIPPTSGTRVLQGLPALIAATWFVDPTGDGQSFEHPLLPLRKSSRSKDEGRGVVRQGLRMHEKYVGLQQVSRVLEILEEVWRRDDEGVDKCDWIVLVASKGLQTLYG